MKYLVSFFVIIILFFSTNVSKAANLTVLIDMDKVMNESLVGKSIIVKLEKINKKNVDEFKKKENLLKQEENSLLLQKNILSKENYSKKVDALKIKVNNYNKNKEEKINSLKKKKMNASAKLLNEIQPILSEYSKENNISLILQKKNVVLGRNDLDITTKIIEIANSRIKSINLD